MKNPRRLFLNQISLMAGVAAFSKPLNSTAAITKRISTWHSAENAVTIYHTNDLHGNFEPVYNCMGGLNHIKPLLESQETGGLLLDAGDFLNEKHQIDEHKRVINSMNAMRYHAAAIGNHELANGQDYLARLAPLMQFKLVNCNYELNAALSQWVSPYMITRSGRFKIGITGVGHQINGIGYRDAIKSANDVAAMLKEKEQCDMVICLSHLGYSQKGDQCDNKQLARQSVHIDMIVSGHNQKLLTGAMVARNKNKQEVIIGQTAWNGLLMGRTIFGFGNSKQKNSFRSKNLIPGQPGGQSYEQSLASLRAMKKQLRPS